MFKQLILIAALALGLAACSDNEQAQMNLDPVAFHSGDECHVCGMIIQAWPGPKGEAIDAKTGQVMKFCSTTDMFSWLLQPENIHSDTAVYVHDMAQSHWDKPNDEYLIDARSAWYVQGSNKMGMGPTLATFATEQAAQEFADKEGGKVLAFADINEQVLREITMEAHEHILKKSEAVHGADNSHNQHQHHNGHAAHAQ